MDATSSKCLINSISRFLHLVSCQTTKCIPIQKDYCSIVGILKHLKPVLDEVVDCKIPSDEYLHKECEELDMIVNEARDFVENWCPKMSKIHGILQSGQLLMKVQLSSLEICHIICRSLQSSPSNSVLTVVQHCLQELKCLKREPVTIYIEEALRSQRENTEPCREQLMKMTESLGLTSNQELLKESMALEKELLKAEDNKMKGKYDEINRTLDLVSNVRNYIMKLQCSEVKTGVSIPPYFQCPLSLELMLEPVIVASGQTYDRSSMQKWLANGLTICPKTRQQLTHTNLIPNYTVKAMIANWSEVNNVKLPNSGLNNSVSVALPSNYSVPQDLTRTYSFQSFLNSSNSAPRSSLQNGNGFEKQKGGVSFRLSGEFNGCHSRETEQFEQPSPAPSYIHSRSESVSSSSSSADYVLPVNEVPKISSKHEDVNVLSGEITSEHPASSPPYKETQLSPWLKGKQFQSPPKKVDGLENGNNNDPRENSLPLSDSASDELTTASHVMKLIEDLNSQSNEVQTIAAEELRLLAKHSMENRIIVGQCGAIMPLLSLLYSEVKVTQEHSVTALLNLSIYEDNKIMIAEAGAIEPLIHVLRTGNDGAKENSAAALFSLSVLETYKARIGRSGAVKALVDLLGSGTLRGKKDAATALFNLSIFHDNKACIIQAGAVKYLVQLMDPSVGMVDKAVALLANLSTIGEGPFKNCTGRGNPLTS
ncbi:RING-type E3 ubiquitin transferase [Quillaja saponaria]|uniref:RING-type E3 ubiquitin transferase n=1 Tax=Quillaja saponaria TaxID=32244 RepID=A0AAD7Q979_QUISA|nr:RING-type E3 ubiquitin transferase [Quillaja saponaria]KAJ7977233.1 RING-type E3 ubiquitin transferase [Quillaja saponaria]